MNEKQRRVRIGELVRKYSWLGDPGSLIENEKVDMCPAVGHPCAGCEKDQSKVELASPSARVCLCEECWEDLKAYRWTP
jgi:hypothetical protein